MLKRMGPSLECQAGVRMSLTQKSLRASCLFSSFWNIVPSVKHYRVPSASLYFPVYLPPALSRLRALNPHHHYYVPGIIPGTPVFVQLVYMEREGGGVKR